MTKAERNDAIVKMYRGGYTQEAIGEMFGIVQAQIGYIVGAEERVERLSLSDNSQKLSTAHEQVLRKAPKHLQDKIAEVVLTRVESAKPESAQAEIQEEGDDNMLVIKYDFSKALYDALVEQFKAENRSNGWYWKLDELVDSFVAVYVIQKTFFSAQDIEGFNEVWETTKDVAKYLVYADDMTNKSTGFLADVLCRNLFINRAFSETSERTKIFRWLGDYSFDLAAVLLKNDEAFRNTVRDVLLNALITLDHHERIGQSALDEVNQRFGKTPQSIRHIGGIIFEKDVGQRKRCHREAMKSLIAITKNYELPADYGDEKESVLDECLGIELAPVKDQSLRSQLEWLEEKGNWVIRNIIQRLQQEFRKQKTRTPDLTANKEYLDAEPDKLAVDPEPIHDSEFSEKQIAQLKSAFGETGANVATAIREDPDASDKELVKSIGKKVGHEISRSTVEKHKKKIRDNAQVFRDIVEG
jgi:hypothetical protein